MTAVTPGSRLGPLSLIVAALLSGCGAVEGPGSTCGDGLVTGGEQCDDGNQETEACIYGEQDCVVCDATCREAPGEVSFCGDEAVTGYEQCDDGNAVAERCDYGVQSCTICDGGCQLVAGLISLCGDGIIDEGEGCDDGNTDTDVCAYGVQSCTVCTSTCEEAPGATALCGDDVVNGDEECDLGPDNTVICPYGQPSCEVCSVYCEWISGTALICGDGVLQTGYGEGCDGSDTADCATLGYDPGIANCTLDCALDSTTCTVEGVPRVQSFPATSSGFTLPPSPTLAINDQDQLTLAYLHASGGSTEVRVAREVAKGEWQHATVAWDADADRGPSVATGPGTLLGVAWPGAPEAGLGDRVLWLARAQDGLTWTASQVGDGAPLDPALALDAGGLATIAYYAYEGGPSARVLVRQEQEDGSWTLHEIAAPGPTGDGLALVLDTAGLPVVAYLHGGSQGDLYVARLHADGSWSQTLVAQTLSPRAWPALTTRDIGDEDDPLQEVIVACGGQAGLLLAPDGGTGDWELQGLVLLGVAGPSHVGVAAGSQGLLHIAWTEVLADEGSESAEVVGLARIDATGYYEKKTVFQWPDWSSQAPDLQRASLVVRADGTSVTASTVVLDDQVIVVSEPPW